MALAARLRDPAIPPWDRLAAADDEEILAILAAYPLRELLTRSASYPLVVHRQRALYGAWYEFFPARRECGSIPWGGASPSGDPAQRRLPAGADRRHGFRRGLPAAGPPDRR